MSSRDPKCIYCLETKPITEFDTEHVVPKSFGRFRDALTLTHPRTWRVCKRCNGHFGRSVDLSLGRDSHEALLRVHRGLFNPTELRKYLRRRIRLRLPKDHPLGPLHLQVVLNPAADNTQLVPVPQVRARLEDGTLVCIPEDQVLETLPQLLPRISEKGISLFWYSADTGAELRLQQLLTQAGHQVNSWKPDPLLPTLEPGDLAVEATATIDLAIARGIAKIAYNYFAWVAGLKASGMLAAADVIPIRRFIRDGIGDWRSFVRPSNEAILTTDSEERRTTDGHLVALSWAESPSASILVRVALFNDITYRVTLVPRYSGMWVDLCRGHHYSLKASAVNELLVGRLIRPPRRR